jgi:hypothetical protein
VQNPLSSSLLPKNIKIKIYRTTILPVVLYGCETWSLTLREEHRLCVLESKVLKRLYGPRSDKVTREWKKNYVMRSLVICTQQILFADQIEKNEMGECSMFVGEKCIRC